MADSSSRYNIASDTQSVSPKSVGDIVSKILRPSLTAYYECHFYPTQQVQNWVKDKGQEFTSSFQDLLTFSCSEASLPGSSLNTIELNNDYTGVTQRHAYRRVYDDRIDFTFYVDHDYSIIKFFEYWISYIANEQISDSDTQGPGLLQQNHFYKINYPINYKSTVYVNKFEKDYTGDALTYLFFEAFPISITSMPVSYDTSSLLKCTVSFTYTRYVVQKGTITPPQPDNNGNQNPTTNNNASVGAGSPAELAQINSNIA